MSLIATPVPVLPWLGDARTLSFPEVSACLLLGWFIVLALPNLGRDVPNGPALGVDVGFRVHRAGNAVRTPGSCRFSIFSFDRAAARCSYLVLLSLSIYFVLFGVILDRPLSLGMFQQQIDAKLARGARVEGPKLVIIAGSNGPFSHRCQVNRATGLGFHA